MVLHLLGKEENLGSIPSGGSMTMQILEDKAKAITEKLLLHAGSFQFLETDNNIQVKTIVRDQTGKVVGAQG